jgi:hypothetical protein
VQNWREYDAALRRRGDLTVWVTPGAMVAWTPPRRGRRGRPQQYSAIAIETGLMLRLAFGRPWRQTEGMLASIMRLLDVDLPVPDHTTFSRRSADLTVAKTLSAASGPVNVVIDSTGLKVFGAGEWQHEKHGGHGRRTWRKLHLAVDPDTGEILASELTTTEDGGFCRKSRTGARKQQVCRAASCGKQVELLGERQRLTAGIVRLLFTQHMNQLDATQDHAGTVSGLEAKHRSHASFDGAVILLNAVIEVLTLPDPDRLEPAS